MENSTGSPPLCTQPQIFWAVNLICSPPPANLTAQEGLRLSPHFRNCLWRETAGIVQLFSQIKETSGKEVLWACLGRGDFESAEGNCRGEGSSEGSAISRRFALRGAAAKQVGSKGITCGVHSRRGWGRFRGCGREQDQGRMAAAVQAVLTDERLRAVQGTTQKVFRCPRHPNTKMAWFVGAECCQLHAELSHLP